MRKSPLWCRDGATLDTSEVRAICPTIHHRNFKYQTQLGGINSVDSVWFSTPNTKQTALIHSTWIPKSDDVFPSWILDSSRGRSPMLEVTRVSWETKAQTKTGIEGLLPGPAPMTHDVCWNLEDDSFGNSAWIWNESISWKVFKLNPWMGSQNGKVALHNHQFLAEPRSPQWFRISETHFSSPKTWP